MANTITSPNMNLSIPIPGVDPGPDYALNLNASLAIIDGHNHASGSGVQINPSGINVNADLAFNNNNLTLARSVRLKSQTSPLALAADIGCLYESGVDLYYNDGAGNQIRITQSGSVSGASGTITGLPSGTASASYGSGTFVFQSATNTPATIDGGSFILRNNVASSKGLTLSPPNSMATNYSLVLPSLPSVQSIMTLDSSGNISAPYTVDNSTLTITSNVIQIKAQGITQGLLAPRTISGSAPLGGVAVSSSSGAFVTTSGSFTTVTNLSVSLVTSGRPVMLMLINDASTNPSYFGAGVTGSAFNVFVSLRYLNGGGEIGRYQTATGDNLTNKAQLLFEGPAMGHLDTTVNGSAGTYTYTVQIQGTSQNNYCQYFKLVAYEI